ncbi:MAG: hypothetical protein AAGG51_24270 [Cyanobacteria bacterium P01_G01_bin.54]
MSPVSTNQLSIFELVGYLFSGIYFEFVFVGTLSTFHPDIFNKIIKALESSHGDLSLVVVAGAFVLAYGLGILCSQFSFFYYYGENGILLRWFFPEPDNYPFKISLKESTKIMVMPWHLILKKLGDYNLIPKKTLSKVTQLDDKEKYVRIRDNYSQRSDKEDSRKARVLVDLICEGIASSGSFLSVVDRLTSRVRFASSVVIINVAFCAHAILHSLICGEIDSFWMIFNVTLFLSLRFALHSFIYKSDGIQHIDLLPSRVKGALAKNQKRIRECFHFERPISFILSKKVMISLFFVISYILVQGGLLRALFVAIIMISTTLFHSEIAQKCANEYWLNVALACTLYCEYLDKQASQTSTTRD